MMSKSNFRMGMLLLVTAVGCGAPPANNTVDAGVSRSELTCQRGRDSLAHAIEAMGSCNAFPLNEMAGSQCEARVGACTEKELDVLDATTDCMLALPACTEATKSSWQDAFMACDAKSQSASTDCRMSVGN